MDVSPHFGFGPVCCLIPIFLVLAVIFSVLAVIAGDPSTPEPFCHSHP